MSKPLLLKLPEYVSVCMLPGRLAVENRVGLGAMAMGAVLEMALGIDILKVEGKKQGPAATNTKFRLRPGSRCERSPCPGVVQATRGSK